MPDEKKKKKFEVPKMTPPEKDVPFPDHFEDDEFSELINASSYTECTGLIPTPPQNEEEMESYMSIYDYQPPDCIDHEEENLQ